MLGSNDFKQINELEKSMDGDSAIRQRLSEIIAGFPQKLEDLVDYYMWELSNFLMEGEEGWSNMLILYLIASTENGLSREDFENLTIYNRNDENLSENPSWCNFWNELKFARMRRFLGPFLVQKNDGKMDFTHRLIREGLRTNQAIKYCSIALLNYFMYGNRNPVTKYDSGLTLCRQLLDKEIADKESIFNATYDYISPLISESGAQSEDEDPEIAEAGEKQLEMFRKSVLMDVSCENGHAHLIVYCEALRTLILNGAGPRQWVGFLIRRWLSPSGIGMMPGEPWRFRFIWRF